MVRRVVVIGAGITGSALAAELSRAADVEVTVLERGLEGALPGSTGHAPGFIGLLSETPLLTELSQTSATIYEGLESAGRRGFDRVGSLELASGDEGVAQLERRRDLAVHSGLPARLLSPARASTLAPDLVDAAECRAALHFPADGTARARVISNALLQQARADGARLVHGVEVTGIDVHGGRISGVRWGSERVAADDVVIAAGIWGPAVAALVDLRLPLVPVAHPYVRLAASERRPAGSPFIRWPEHHVYARAHGKTLGLGSYDHAPLPIPVDELGAGAERPWLPEFETVIQRGLRLLPDPAQRQPEERLNGVFSMTADNQPLVGAVEGFEGLWAAEALWVTHAGGAARLLARVMTGSADQADLEPLQPNRFHGQAESDLHTRAMQNYRGID